MKKIVFFIGLFLLTIYSFGQTKITSGEVNFRTSPEIKENKISIIPKGTIVKKELSIIKIQMEIGFSLQHTIILFHLGHLLYAMTGHIVLVEVEEVLVLIMVV